MIFGLSLLLTLAMTIAARARFATLPKLQGFRVFTAVF